MFVVYATVSMLFWATSISRRSSESCLNLGKSLWIYFRIDARELMSPDTQSENTVCMSDLDLCGTWLAFIELCLGNSAIKHDTDLDVTTAPKICHFDTCKSKAEERGDLGHVMMLEGANLFIYNLVWKRSVSWFLT